MNDKEVIKMLRTIEETVYLGNLKFYEAIDAAIKALEQPTVEPEQRWIPCSERLPEESGLYIVTNVGRWVEPVGTRYYNIRADGGFWSGHPGDKVLAWMPLPTLYREEGDQE